VIVEFATVGLSQGVCELLGPVVDVCANALPAVNMPNNKVCNVFFILNMILVCLPQKYFGY